MHSPEKLIKGYKGFHKQYFVKQKKLYRELAKGQSPKFLVISCCDSRIHPVQIFDSQPGELFVIRNVANLVPAKGKDDDVSSTSAAIEFAVEHLNIKHIIVLGHSKCGGIQSLIKGASSNNKSKYISSWLNIAKPVRDRVLTEYAHKNFIEQSVLCEKLSIVNSLKNLESYPFIRERYAAKKLFIYGWYFDIETGNLLEKRGDLFHPL